MNAMKRRGFLAAMLKAGAAFSILPAAELTKRLWVPQREVVQSYVQFTWKPMPDKWVNDGGLWQRTEIKQTNGVLVTTDCGIVTHREMEIEWKMEAAAPMTKWAVIKL